MTEENNNEKNHCGSKKGAMLAYGIIQLGTSVISCCDINFVLSMRTKRHLTIAPVFQD